jgi:glycosyltransferase involved in cell wall biosynthesis
MGAVDTVLGGEEERPADGVTVLPRAGRAVAERPVDLSVLIPVYNEADNLQELLTALTSVLGTIGRRYEIVAVDDGSVDGSYQTLLRLRSTVPGLRVVRLRRNFGQTAALAAGFDFARGDVIVTLDADLQNDPGDIPDLLATLEEEGVDLVTGWRWARQDALLRRRLPSWIANWVISRVTRVRLHDYGCTLRVYRAEVAKRLRLYGELHRFIPALAVDLGATVAERRVRHHRRIRGESKYGLSRTVRVLLDLLTVKFLSGYSTRPIQVFGVLGMVSTLIGVVWTAYLGFERLVFHRPLANRPVLLLTILLTVIGVQFISLGLLGEMLARTYHESQAKPIYSVREVSGYEQEDEREAVRPP